MEQIQTYDTQELYNKTLEKVLCLYSFIITRLKDYFKYLRECNYIATEYYDEYFSEFKNEKLDLEYYTIVLKSPELSKELHDDIIFIIAEKFKLSVETYINSVEKYNVLVPHDVIASGDLYFDDGNDYKKCVHNLKVIDKYISIIRHCKNATKKSMDSKKPNDFKDLAWPFKITFIFEKVKHVLTLAELLEKLLEVEPTLVNKKTSERMVTSVLSGTLKYHIGKKVFNRYMANTENAVYVYGMDNWFYEKGGKVFVKKEYLRKQ